MIKRFDMKQAVTLKDIAIKVHRSITTVSRALQGYSDVSLETIDIVRKTADEMQYVPNVFAQRLQKQSTDTIGFIAPDSSDGYAEPFFCEFLAGIGEAASANNFDLLVAFCQETNQIPIYKKMIDEGKVDGFILNRTFINDQRVVYLQKRHFPFAVFGQVENASNYSFIDEDGTLAMSLIVNHLVERGHKRIACLCPPLTFMFSSIRLNSLQTELGKHGLPLQKQYICTHCFNQKDGYTQTMKLLSLNKPPTAIVCFTDSIAFGAIEATKSRGITVGKDFAITGFDDIPLSEFFTPSLTTIRQPIRKIGYEATEILLSHLRDIKKGEKISPLQILLEPTLILRESS